MRMQARDLEMLRTLARLQLATTRELVNAFFSTPKVGQRRVRNLEVLELIVRHTKGATDPSYFAWRLTKCGVAAVMREFPEEALDACFDVRVAGLSLGDIRTWERETLNRLYLELVGEGRCHLVTAEKAPGWNQLRRWIAGVRRRANAFAWHPYGSTVFEWRDPLGREFRVAPDATIVTANARFFLELISGQATPPAKIAEKLRRYARLLQQDNARQCPDGKTPVIVILVGGERDRKKVQEVLSGLVLDRPSCKVKILIDDPDVRRGGAEAVRWLAKVLLGEVRSRADGAAAEVVAPVEDPGGDDLCVGCILGNTFIETTAELLKTHPDALRDWMAVVNRKSETADAFLQRWIAALDALWRHHHRAAAG